MPDGALKVALLWAEAFKKEFPSWYPFRYCAILLGTIVGQKLQKVLQSSFPRRFYESLWVHLNE